MAVVVAQNPAMVHLATFQVDLGQVMSDNLAILEPDLLIEYRALALAFEGVNLGQHRLNRARSLAHANIVTQIGRLVSCLLRILKLASARWARRGCFSDEKQPRLVQYDALKCGS